MDNKKSYQRDDIIIESTAWIFVIGMIFLIVSFFN
jgi:hypothetical protein